MKMYLQYQYRLKLKVTKTLESAQEFLHWYSAMVFRSHLVALFSLYYSLLGQYANSKSETCG